MAPSFEYAVLMAVPDPRRGERINLGIVVFRPERIDVRILDAAAKLRALTGREWVGRLDAVCRRVQSVFEPGASAGELRQAIVFGETFVEPSELGWLTAKSEAQYEEAVDEILTALVATPRRKRSESQTRINTEISQFLDRSKILAKGDEDINTGKVVKNFPIAPNEGLIADFAVKNGHYCFANTLDLRKQMAPVAEAALKSITLHKAADVFGSDILRIGVYAVQQSDIGDVSKHIALLDDYADKIFNWLDPMQRRQFERTIFDALPPIAEFQPS